MAIVNALNGAQLLIQIGDGQATEVFSQPCVINTERGIEFSGDIQETLLPDCANPALIAWKGRTIDGLAAEITGAGILDTTSLDIVREFFEEGVSRNIRVKVNTTALLGGGWWEGKAICSRYAVRGPSRKEKQQFDCTILSDGELPWVDVP